MEIFWNSVVYAAFSIFVYLSTSVAASRGKPKSVTTLLDAKWQTTPIILEVSEFLADENKHYFWGYLDRMADYSPDFLRQQTDREFYDLVLKEASHFISPAKLNLLKFSLSLRSYSPTVEMFHQIALHRGLPEGCTAVIEVNSAFTCSLMEFDDLILSATNRTKAWTYKVDHHFADAATHNVVVVLYGELGTSSFREFHFILQDYAKKGKFDYVVRHYLQDRPEKKVRLSGYGVELNIKSTEYKSQDDRKIKADGEPTDIDTEEQRDEIEGFIFSKLKRLHSDLVVKLDKFRDHLLESTNEITPLKVWQTQDLGNQAAERIMLAPIEEALRVMRDISQNFPIQAQSLVQTTVREELRQEMAKNQNMFSQHHNLGASDTSIFINGIYFDLEYTDIFGILTILRQELRIMEELHRIGVQESELSKILNLDFGSLKQDYVIDIRDSSILYLNDLENDRQYSGWPSSITELLRPSYPGMLRSIRKNIFHLVLAVDPCDDNSKEILKLTESLYIHKAPLRIGLVFAVNVHKSADGFGDCGVAMLNAFNFIAETTGKMYNGLSFITDVYARVGKQKVTVEDVIKIFKSKHPKEDFELIFGEDSDYDTSRKLAKEFLQRTGMTDVPHVLMNGMRLDKKYLNGDYFEEAIVTEIMQQTPPLQKAVYKGELTDSHDALDYLMDLPNVMPRVNKRIFNETWKLLDMTGISSIELSPSKFAELSNTDMTATILAHTIYLTAREDNNFRPITNWVVVDLEFPLGREILLNALDHLRSSNDVRLGIVFNPSVAPAEDSHRVSKTVQAILQTLNKKACASVIKKILQPDVVNGFTSGKVSISTVAPTDLDMDAFAKAFESAKDILKIHRRFCKNVLKFVPGESGIVSNGRVLGPFEASEVFLIDDFQLLERHSLSIYGDKLREVFQSINSEGELDSISDLGMRVVALMLGRQTPTRVDLKYKGTDHSVIKIPPKSAGQPVFDIKVIVDPLSKGAQKVAPLLMVLEDVLNANIWVFLNSQDKLSDLPLKNFYRAVLEPEIQFDKDDSFAPGPMAKFTNMPSSPLFTLQLITPENWLVEVMRTPYDLDNIHLEKVNSIVWSEFELEHLIIEGHCFDQMTGNPPRGLQFTLGTYSNPVMVDTIVMANLGYFQLKANPGTWILQLREGRSADIYDISSHEGTDSPPDVVEPHIVLNSFRSTVIKIKVSKKLDKLDQDLLADDSKEGSGLWGSITKTFGGGSHIEEKEDENRIDIFSLASGHLYERLLRIMMLSVLKHTKTPVKFWFLKNFLSPSFKDFLPAMAKHYNFEYELVQYKWPRWLHQQTEKQRIIWGYKILFLDVLFPLNVKKIIFVDADQVVRTDMKELRDFDLGGAPYGYTPFCESRKDMDGYRFWKSGYWATHLQGRKYHISALYVVDLKRFRRVAAGDRLRGQYQGLSQDPNSLSNLDQDLPNNMIHQVAIKSLPQEWLWCETWCEDSTKAKAKTIDLCNNPMTKESKLSSAMRIIQEWKGYDDEIRELMNQYEDSKYDIGDSKDNDIIDDQRKREFHQEL